MILAQNTKKQLINIGKEKEVYLTGNILKILVGDESDPEFNEYLQESIKRDNETKKKRLEITKQIQNQNKELSTWREENQKLMDELKLSLEESNRLKEDALKAKDIALDDLDVLQKRKQTELIGEIVKVALWVIVGVGFTTSLLYAVVLIKGGDSKIIESTWSNLFGILLTNSFSIIGTIMGVKYASETK